MTCLNVFLISILLIQNIHSHFDYQNGCVSNNCKRDCINKEYIQQTPGDNGFKIIIEDDYEFYKPNQTYKSK
jgi:hypothetical protein